MYYFFRRNRKERQKAEGRRQKDKKLTIKQPLAFSILLLIFFILSSIFSGCAPYPQIRTDKKSYNVQGEQYYPITESQGYVEEGIASWYGKDFHGKKTSSGEVYDMNLKTAAHKTLPLGTYVKVTDLKNNRTTVVRINDRGPFVRGRIIDLSYGAAQELGIDITGTTEVKIEALDKDDIKAISIKDFNSGNFTIQVGAFKNKENALQLTEQLKRMYQTTHVVTFNSDEGIFYRVRVGKFHLLDKARDAREELEERGYEEAMVVAE
ncbi:MAG: septal ring lytic transglycosylase RlpA family protein [Candidatus Firestonebacteria bacterium]|nr:septal ring lytic transglycosylase RlpA family protein [Candidatus Firestonebacteria bacterium]